MKVMSAGEKTSAIAAVDPRGNRNTEARTPHSIASTIAPEPPMAPCWMSGAARDEQQGLWQQRPCREGDESRAEAGESERRDHDDRDATRSGYRSDGPRHATSTILLSASASVRTGIGEERETMGRNRQLFTICLGALFVAACGRTSPASAGRTPAAAEPQFVPGLGELMSLQQMRHVKLWLAGEAANWELADYEVDELGEGFDDIVKFHPTHKDSPVAPKDAIPRMVTQPLADVRAAVGRKDAAAFTRAYDALTASCNDCHRATNFGFNQVQRPASNPYPNQQFAPSQR